MKRSVAVLMTALTMILIVFVGCKSIFQIGDTVPDFTMPDQYGEDVTLSDVLSREGSNGAILAFYILDNSPG